MSKELSVIKSLLTESEANIKTALDTIKAITDNSVMQLCSSDGTVIEEYHTASLTEHMLNSYVDEHSNDSTATVALEYDWRNLYIKMLEAAVEHGIKSHINDLLMADKVYITVNKSPTFIWGVRECGTEMYSITEKGRTLPRDIKRYMSAKETSFGLVHWYICIEGDMHEAGFNEIVAWAHDYVGSNDWYRNEVSKA